MTVRHGYLFSDVTDEMNRLRTQSAVLDPLTTRLFTEAGLAPGMRVLDLGSGTGNVAMLAAAAVGPEGRVVGVDRDPKAIQHARHWAESQGRGNIDYHESDLMTLDGVDAGFDAVVGRAVLMHVEEPEVALRTAISRVRTGGLVCMHEPDLAVDWAHPVTPLWRQVRAWISDTLARVGADERMGMSLFPIFRALGLPDARMLIEASGGSRETSPAFGWASIVASIVPVMEQLQIATADEVQADDLTERLNAELEAHDGFVLSPLMIGAWSHVPE